MSKDLRDQIYRNLDSKETEELADIWQKNNHLEWSELAFSALQDILQERLGELPPQGKPVWSKDDIQIEDDDVIQEEDKDPVFYDPEKVMGLEKWCGKLAIIILVISTIVELGKIPSYTNYLKYLFPVDVVRTFVIIILIILTIAAEVILVYVPLKALSAILRILMGMEFNSRKVLDTSSCEDNVAAYEKAEDVVL